jgi:hypothetical protein
MRYYLGRHFGKLYAGYLLLLGGYWALYLVWLLNRGVPIWSWIVVAIAMAGVFALSMWTK